MAYGGGWALDSSECPAGLECKVLVAPLHPANDAAVEIMAIRSRHLINFSIHDFIEDCRIRFSRTNSKGLVARVCNLTRQSMA